jgi:hypothetical protein
MSCAKCSSPCVGGQEGDCCTDAMCCNCAGSSNACATCLAARDFYEVQTFLQSHGITPQQSVDITEHLRGARYEVNNMTSLRALEDADLEFVFQSIPTGPKAIIKKALRETGGAGAYIQQHRMV